MDIVLGKEETAEILGSLRRFFREEIEIELNELQSRTVLSYFLKDVAPFAYNKGVADAEGFMRGRLEDLTSACFETPLTYWSKGKKG